ncbi:MAG: hypothetical protein Q6J68_00365 [Thermostichales cyanobacterium SZTDM-1c_bins_54]
MEPSLEALLRQLIQLLPPTHPPLGFGDPPTPVYVFCNRRNNCLWYTLDDQGEPVPIVHKALTGYIQDLSFPKTERRGKEVWKLHLTVKADRTYILESGYDTQFSKSVLAALATLTPAAMQQPITIQPQPGEDESVLFARLWLGQDPIKSEYNAQTDWKTVAQQALAVVRGIPDNR